MLKITLAAAVVALCGAAQAQTIIGAGKPSFPIVINQAGSYKLANNLSVPAGVGAISITAPGVTLDLAGYTVAGPVSCASAGVCNMAAAGVNGIGSSAPNTVIRNGTVKGFQGNGVSIAGMSQLEDLMVSENANMGIVGGNMAQGANLIKRVRATLNKVHGIYLFESVLHECASSDNGSLGYYLNSSTIVGSAASGNLSVGVFGGSHLLLQGVRAVGNSGGNFGGSYVSAGGNMNDWTLF